MRYRGFKEELYLGGFRPNDSDARRPRHRSESVIAVLRTPPDGALYHRAVRGRFDEILETSLGLEHVTTVLLPRDRGKTRRYSRLPRVVIPPTAIDAPSLIARADLMIGGGGTMTREVRAPRGADVHGLRGALAAVDAELVRRAACTTFGHRGASRGSRRGCPPRRQSRSSAPTRSFASCPRRWPMSRPELELSPAELRRRAQTFLTDVVRREDALFPYITIVAKRRVCA